MGIPRIIEYLEEDNRLILIEEYISGCSLQDMIDDGKLSLTDIFCYMLELCNILEILHAHSPAIIHRDIKPSNIIITNYNKAVLLDFNAAKYYSEQEKIRCCLVHRAMQPRNNTALAHPLPKQTFILWAFS